MNQDSTRIVPIVLLLLGVTAMLVALVSPRYLSDYYYLGAVIFVEAMLLALWDYSRRFFPVLLAVFLWAGIDVPLGEIWTSRRWFVLAIAALGGFIMYMKDRHHVFLPFHLVALGCVVSAVISAMVSSYPQIALLKALSLLLLFAYAATGARLAVMGREAKFCSGLLLGCEGLTYITAISYFILRRYFFGNPNSLGAVAGVVGLPVLLWGVLVSEDPGLRRRRIFALILALLLLLDSYSRAGIVAAIITCSLFCMSLRRYRLLLKGMALALLSAILVATFAPIGSAQSSSLLTQFVYKGDDQNGLLASRRSVWDDTATSIRQHPWFGSGFGTTSTNYDATISQVISTTSNAAAAKEHGSSYLAIAEWVGLLGVVPFFALVLITALNATRVMVWLRRTGDPFSPAVPLALVVIAGLIHAAFEDWMFAVGYYLCVLFWSLAFILLDVLPKPAPNYVMANAPHPFAPPADLGYTVPVR